MDMGVRCGVEGVEEGIAVVAFRLGAILFRIEMV